MKSVSKRLLVWLLSALAVTSLLSGVVTYLLVRSDTDEMLHRELRQIALTVDPLIQIRPVTSVPRPTPTSALAIAVQVSDAGGRLLYRSAGGIDIPLSLPDGFAHLKVAGRSWHVYTHRDGGRIVQVAQCSSPERDLSEQAGLSATLPVLAILPVLAALIVVLVRRSFSPVRQVLMAAAQRGAEDLSPLPLDGVPQEVLPLVTDINRLFARLDEALSAQRRFVSDAAHALRTPLTALQIELSNVRYAPTEDGRWVRLSKLEEMCARASHLVTQLLRMARQESGVPPSAFKRLELSALVRACLVEHLPLADRKRIDLGVTDQAATSLMGDSEAIRVLVDNLIDNAIRYTPAEGIVDVAVRQEGGEVVLELSDTGPGIPPALRDRVFDRFFRIEGNGAEGSGLGLSIVRSIAERHSASIRMSERPEGGTRVQVAFPACPPAGM